MSASDGAGLGQPCWVSLLTKDLATAHDFYGAVLGWTFRAGSFGEGFSVALSDGKPVAGLSDAARSMGIAASWTSYFAVADADVVASRVRERGGTVAVGPLAVGNGRVVLAADSAGAVFGIWEGKNLPGWRIGAGAAPAWLELRTRDAFAAAMFYGEIFDWTVDRPDRCEVRYEDDAVIVRSGGRTVACIRGGAIEADPDPRIRPRWHVYFRVDDVEKAVEAALGSGGAVVSEPTHSRAGREATLRDREGALFTVTEKSGC
ncbi:VOC family protein [Streptomyces cinnamoneus]|uniref:VOC family protein n=1 Tax=Streptomyces cinnamoneus TaxID=53446 RepID=UPI0033FD14A0